MQGSTKQNYGGDPSIEITRPDPIRVRHQVTANISGKRTTLGNLIDRMLERIREKNGYMPGHRVNDTPSAEAKRERQRARRKQYLTGDIEKKEDV